MFKFLDAQVELIQAFESGDFEKFEVALARGAEPTVHYNNQGMCIFERALSTPDCYKFIDCCLSKCCENTYVNREINKAAVNYVAESADPKNLETLLVEGICAVNVDHQYEGETALNTLCKNLNTNNVKKSTKCIRKLINYGASHSIPDNEGKTPFQYVLENTVIDSEKQKCKIIMEFLSIAKLSKSEYEEGLAYLLTHELDGYNEKLYTTLSRQLVSLDVDQMLSKLAQYRDEVISWNETRMHFAMLSEVIENKRENALKAVLAVMRSNSEEDNLNLVKKAVELHHTCSDVLALLKNNSFIFNYTNKLDLFKFMVLYLTICIGSSEHHEECLELFLEGNQSNINDLMLIAVQARNRNAILLLLSKGARLNKEYKSKKYIIGKIEPDLLEKHFDSCIVRNNTSMWSMDHSHSNDNEPFQLDMSFSNFINNNNVLDVNIIHQMAEIKELRPLLTHPLIDSLLQIIWMRLHKLFYAHLAVFTILCISLVAQILHRSQKEKTEINAFLYIAIFIGWVITAYLAINELLTVLQVIWPILMELICQLRSILKSGLNKKSINCILKLQWQIFKNIFFGMDLWRIVMLTLTCLEYGSHKTQNTIAVITISLTAIKMNYLFGTVPIASISTNMLMLREVAHTFIKCLTQYSIFVFAFGLCFYVLFNNFDQKELNYEICQFNADKNQSTIDEGPVTFLHPFGTFIKTFMMFFGQYEINTEFNSFYTGWILVLFMFMAMILTNLLGALAVSDIQTVQEQAGIRAAMCRTKLLNSYEFALQGGWGQMKLLRRAYRAILRNIHERYNFRGIYLRPYQSNRAYIYRSSRTSMSMERLGLKVDNDTVQRALKIIDKRNLVVEEKSDEKIEKQFMDMSASVQNKFNHMSNLFENRFERLENMSTMLDKKLENILAVLQKEEQVETLKKPKPLLQRQKNVEIDSKFQKNSCPKKSP